MDRTPPARGRNTGRGRGPPREGLRGGRRSRTVAGVSRPRRVRYLAEGWGVGELLLDGKVVLWHELPTPHPSSRTGDGQAPAVTLAEIEHLASDGSVPRVLLLLAAYFGGERTSFAGLDIDLDWCTPFQLAVAHALRDVPYGETVTYGELAALAGFPSAQRAAGSFCARNRLSLILPCHRVVSAGGLGSYGSLGTAYKRRLLELERAAL